MKKFLIPVLAILIIIAGVSGYLVGIKNGINQGIIKGKAILQQELQVKEEAYKKSKEAARELATKYLNAYKFNDLKEAYSLTCQEFKSKSDEQKFVKFWEEGIKNLQDNGVVIQDYLIDDVVMDNNIAKIRYSEVRMSALLSKEIKLPQQSEFKLVDGEWCAFPSIDAN